MDESTRFLVERMDEHHKELRDEMCKIREDIADLKGFKQKVIGASMVVSGAVALLIDLVKK